MLIIKFRFRHEIKKWLKDQDNRNCHKIKEKDRMEEECKEKEATRIKTLNLTKIMSTRRYLTRLKNTERRL